MGAEYWPGPDEPEPDDLPEPAFYPADRYEPGPVPAEPASSKHLIAGIRYGPAGYEAEPVYYDDDEYDWTES